MDIKSDLRGLEALAELVELCSNNPHPMDASVSHTAQVCDVVFSAPGRPMRGSGYL